MKKPLLPLPPLLLKVLPLLLLPALLPPLVPLHPPKVKLPRKKAERNSCRVPVAGFPVKGTVIRIPSRRDGIFCLFRRRKHKAESRKQIMDIDAQTKILLIHSKTHAQ